MDSLNSYVSDDDLDSFSDKKQWNHTKTIKSRNHVAESDANCELMTMDMSEDSCDEGNDKKGRFDNNYVNFVSRPSLSPSPPTSESSQAPPLEADDYKKSRDDEFSKRRSSGHDTKHEDKYRERMGSDFVERHKESNRDRDCHRSYRSHRSRSRSQSRSTKFQDSRSNRVKGSQSPKHSGAPRRRLAESPRRSGRSRDHSRDRHLRSSRHHREKSSRRSRSHSRRHSPRRSRSPHSRRHHSSRNYREKSPRRSPATRTSSRSHSRSHQHYEKPSPIDRRAAAKMHVLEKMGIELKGPLCTDGMDGLKAGIESVLQASGSQPLTPQLILQKTMEEQVEKVKSATGIALPSYYNPVAVNPSKYAEQIQKRRLLWGKKDNPSQQATSGNAADAKAGSQSAGGSTAVWKSVTVGGDRDGKMTAKFKRLMGIRDEGEASLPGPNKGEDLLKKQEEMFNSMESQYEVARMATHTHRGVGLGFGTFQPK